MLAMIRGAYQHGWTGSPVFVVAAIVLLAILLAAIWFGGGEPEPDGGAVPGEQHDFDPFAGGYPVPPMPGQVAIGTVPGRPAEGDREATTAPRRATATNGVDA